MYKEQKRISYIYRYTSKLSFMNRILIFMPLLFFSLLYFTVILFSYISLDPDAHSCVAEIIQSMKLGTGNKLGKRSAYAQRFALSLLLVFRLLFLLSARYFEAFSFERFDNKKRADVT